MSCKGIRDKLSSHLDGLLDSAESREVEEHLAGCDGCRDEYAAMTELVTDLGRLEPVPVPGDLLDDLGKAFRAEVARDAEAAAPLPSLLDRLGGYRVAAGIAAVIFATVVIVNERADAPAGPTSSSAKEYGALDEEAPVDDSVASGLRENEDTLRPPPAVRKKDLSGDDRQAKVGEEADEEVAEADSKGLPTAPTGNVVKSGRPRKGEPDGAVRGDRAGSAEQPEEDKEAGAHRWKTFERYYDGLVAGAEDDPKAERGWTLDRGADREGADEATIRLLRAAHDLSKADGLEAPPGNESVKRVEGFLGVLEEQGAEDKRALEKKAAEKMVGGKKAGVTKRLRGRPEGARTAAPAPAAGAAAKPSPVSEPVQCYFVFGADAGKRLRASAKSFGGKIAATAIADLGAKPRGRVENAAADGEQISVTMSESSARKLVAALRKEKGLGLRLFSQRPRFALEPSDATAPGGAEAPRPQGGVESTAERARDAGEEASSGKTPSEKRVTIHFIVPR